MMKQGNEEGGLLQLIMLTTQHPERDGGFEMLHYVVGMKKSPMNGRIVMKRLLLL